MSLPCFKNIFPVTVDIFYSLYALPCVCVSVCVCVCVCVFAGLLVGIVNAGTTTSWELESGD